MWRLHGNLPICQILFLTNICSYTVFHVVYNLRITKFNTILSVSQPAIRPSSTSAMAPDFSPKKGNRI